MWNAGRCGLKASSFSAGCKQAYDISSPYINRGLEDCLFLTVKNTRGRRRNLSVSTKSVSDFLKSSHDRVQSEHKARSFYRIGMASDDDDVVPRFTIDSETDRQYSRFNASGTELTVRFYLPQ